MPVHHKIISKSEFDDLCLLYNKAYSRWLQKVYSRVLARGELVEDNGYFHNWSLTLKVNEPVVSILINFSKGRGRGRVTVSKFVYRGFSLGSHRDCVLQFRTDFAYAAISHRLMSTFDGAAKICLTWNSEKQYYILDTEVRPSVSPIILPPGRAGKRALFVALKFLYAFINLIFKNLTSHQFRPLSRSKFSKVKSFFPNLRAEYNDLVQTYNSFSASDYIIYSLILFLKKYDITFALLTIAARSNLNFEQITMPQEMVVPVNYEDVPSLTEMFRERYMDLYRHTIWQFMR